MQQEMKYIYMVYQKGSFSKAAQALYMTQPALSIAVQRVEAQIGMPLFRRDRQPLELTEAGKLYIEKIRQMEILEQELEQQLQDLSQLKTGTLRLGGSHYFNSYVLPPVLAQYQSRWPGVRLELTEGGSARLLTLLEERQIDLTFHCMPAPRERLHRIPAFRDTILLAVPRDFPVNQRLASCALTAADVRAGAHRKEGCPTVDLRQLANTPFLLLTPGNNLRERALSFFQEAGIAPPVVMEVSQLVTAYHLACSGLGAVFISDRLVVNRGENMLYYPLLSPLATRTFDIVLPGKTYISQAQKVFVQLFCEFYRNTLPEVTGDTPSSPRKC